MYLPDYQCPVCRTHYFGIHTMLECQTQHRIEEKKMIENQAHAKKIELLDRALEYSKANQISLAEAQKEINDFLNPPTCPYTAHFGTANTRCALPANHTGHHQDARGSSFYIQRDEVC